MLRKNAPLLITSAILLGLSLSTVKPALGQNTSSTSQNQLIASNSKLQVPRTRGVLKASKHNPNVDAGHATASATLYFNGVLQVQGNARSDSKRSQWVDTIWAVKDGQYLDALSELLSLGKFKHAQDWLNIIEDLKQENYLDALSTAFKLAEFEDGKSLAEAAIAVREGNLIEAFYESFDLIEGGSGLKDAFKALQEFDIPDFIASMKNAVDALPILLKLV